ncbi:MAG: hypothetical protein H0W87_08595 [Actinobacteria bacterium]|nr:hypothetical protein [Actinomycetota bacterium]
MSDPITENQITENPVDEVEPRSATPMPPVEDSIATAPTGEDRAATEEGGSVATIDDTPSDSLLSTEHNERFRSRWEELQASFVDRPQEAVQGADALVTDVMQRVTASLTKERERLESQWAQGDDVSTEDLRVALTRYRTFFDRLLSA